MTPLRVLLAVLAAALFAQPASAAPLVATAPVMPVDRAPWVSAASYIVYDETYDLVLAEKDADRRLPMASTTKIMTGLLAFEEADRAQAVPVSARAADVGESEIGLVEGEVLPLGDLARVLLIRSANDASMAVAEAIGGSVEGFVEMMNERAEELGLSNTHFANPHGLDAPGHYSSARDLLELARVAMEVPEFAEAVGTLSHRIQDAPDGTERVARATNHLLTEYPGAIGVKTGFTFQAKLVLVAAAEREGRRIFAVVMGSEGERAHFEDAKRLLDLGFDGYRIVSTVMAGVPFLPESGGLLQREALAETSVHLAFAGLSGTGVHPSVEVPLELPEPLPVSPEPLPELDDAAGWLTRYWQWLVGG